MAVLICALDVHLLVRTEYGSIFPNGYVFSVSAEGGFRAVEAVPDILSILL